MRYKTAAALILIVLFGAASPEGAKEEPVAESMRKLAAEIFGACEKRNRWGIRSFYKKRSGALFFWERKMTYSWEQLDGTIDALIGAASKLRLTTSEFRSGGSGSTGWFAAIFHIDRVTPEGKESSSDGRWTVIAQKRDG